MSRHVTRLALFGVILVAPVVAQAGNPVANNDLLAAARQVISDANFVTLITQDASGRARSRVMDPLPPDDHFVIWMATNPLSRKVEEIRRDPRVTLHWFRPDPPAYVTLHGRATLVDDPAAKQRHWKPDWEPHYANRDEALLLIRVVPERLEVVDPEAGVIGDAETWQPLMVSLGPGEDAPLMVYGGTLVTVDEQDTVIRDGAVLIVDGEIAAVGSAADLHDFFPKSRLIDARGGLILPGMVNAHTHAPMTLFRGLADDLPLMEWLQEHIFPAEAEFVDEDFVRLGTRLACAEMLRSGTTTFADMYYFEDAIAEEVDACGMRAVLGETLIDFPAPDHATWDDAYAYTREFVNRWKDHPRVTAAVAPHAPYTVSPEHLQAAGQLAEELDAPLLIHLAEDRSELATIDERYGTTPVRHLDSLGVLDDRVLAAHMVWPDEEEIGLLAERGVGVAHCPQSNMKVAAGIAPVPAMLAAGVDLGLGTDGPASNNDLSLWQEMDTAAKLHKVNTFDPTVVSAREAVRMATIGGARALDLDDRIGSLEVGKRADLIVVTTDGLHQSPASDPYSLLVYSTTAADVRTVVVDGKVVVDEGAVLTVDVDGVRRRAVQLRQKIEEGPTASH